MDTPDMLQRGALDATLVTDVKPEHLLDHSLRFLVQASGMEAAPVVEQLIDPVPRAHLPFHMFGGGDLRGHLIRPALVRNNRLVRFAEEAVAHFQIAVQP